MSEKLKELLAKLNDLETESKNLISIILKY